MYVLYFVLLLNTGHLKIICLYYYLFNLHIIYFIWWVFQLEQDGQTLWICSSPVSLQEKKKQDLYDTSQSVHK